MTITAQFVTSSSADCDRDSRSLGEKGFGAGYSAVVPKRVADFQTVVYLIGKRVNCECEAA